MTLSSWVLDLVSSFGFSLVPLLWLSKVLQWMAIVGGKWHHGEVVWLVVLKWVSLLSEESGFSCACSPWWLLTGSLRCIVPVFYWAGHRRFSSTSKTFPRKRKEYQWATFITYQACSTCLEGNNSFTPHNNLTQEEGKLSPPSTNLENWVAGG